MRLTALIKGLITKIILIVLVLSFVACNKRATGIFAGSIEVSSAADVSPVGAPFYLTWSSLGEMEYGNPYTPQPLEIPPDDFFPWAGIVSHHILAHNYIDAWFSCLSQLREISRFFIISPDHYGVALQPFSLTAGSWDSGNGLVESDREKVLELALCLDVALDPNVFFMEHGVSALMPYIKKYFPLAQAIAVAVNAESEVNTLTGRKLADILEKEFDDDGKQENFLIISSDFSHNGNIQETAFNDSLSMRYLNNETESFWNMVICDNRTGIYVLDHLGKIKTGSYASGIQPNILYHTNSFNISGYNEDITSYFFVFFADVK